MNLANGFVGLLLFVLVGCAAVPAGIGKGEAVAFVHEESRYPRAPVELSNAAIGQSAKTGTGTGMLVGAAWGLTCGPFAIICSPILAVAGGLGGATLGAGVGVLQGLPGDLRERLQRRVDSFVAMHDVREGVMTAIVDRGKGHWVAVAPSNGASVVRVRIEHVSLYSDQTGRVGLAMGITVAAKPAGADPRDAVEKTFEYVGVSSDPRLWIDDPDGFVTASFRHGYAHVAQNVFAFLAR